MKAKWFNLIVAVSLVALALIPAGGAYAVSGGSRNPSSDAKVTGPRVDTTSALVQLKGAPLSTYVKTKPA